MKIRIPILTCLWLLVSSLTALSDDLTELRLLISKSSEIKKEYLLTKQDFITTGSLPGKFGDLKLSITEIIKKAEKHIEEVQVPSIAPAMFELWLETKKEENLSYPIYRSLLEFRMIELCKYDEFVYWKVHFDLRQGFGTGPPYPIFVATYLDGSIAKIVDPKKQE